MADEDEAEKALNEKINKVVHAALSDFGRKQAAARKEELDKGFAEFGGKFLDQVKALIPQPELDPKAGDDKNKGALSPEAEARLKQAEAVAAKAAKDAEKAKQDAAVETRKREAAELAQRQTEERQQLQDALVAGKARAGVIPMAVGHLQTRIEREKNDDGSFGPPKFKDADGVLQPIAKGVADYLKTPEGKELLPASAAGGAGSGRPGAGAQGGQGEVGFAELGQHLGLRRPE